MKLIKSLILSAAVLFSALVFASCGSAAENAETPTVSIQTTTEPALKDDYGVGYRDNGDGTLTVTYYGGEDKDVSIPIDFSGKAVKSVGRSAFKGSDIESVTMPEGMETIEGYAFALCKNLDTVNIPEGVKSIGQNAFFATFALKETELPESLETIEPYAFYASALEEIIIPENVTSIGESAFSDCKNLSVVQIMSAGTAIAENAFDSDSELTIIAPSGSPAIETAKNKNITYYELESE